MAKTSVSGAEDRRFEFSSRHLGLDLRGRLVGRKLAENGIERLSCLMSDGKDRKQKECNLYYM